MKNGNATLRSWFHLCVLLLAVLPAVARAGNSFSFTANSYGTAYIGAGYIGAGGLLYSTLQNYFVQGYGPVNEGDPNGRYVGINSPGNYALQVGWGEQPGGTWYTVNVYWDGDQATIQVPATMQVALMVKNNLNRAQTISCTGAASQTLGALTTTTLTFIITGNVGSMVTLASSPDQLVIEGNTDPIMILAQGGAVSRTAHIGTPTAAKRVHAVFINYSTSLVRMIPTLDGQSIGSVDAHASDDGVTPKSTSYDWMLDLSADSALTFVAPPGQSARVQTYQVGDLISYVVTIGSANPQNTSTTTDPTSGQTTTTTTDPTTGTTTIDRTTPNTPTNTSTNPGNVFGGNNTGSAGTGSTYTNTTPHAGSAANQDAANSLAGMAVDVKRIRENSDAERQDRDANLSADSKAQVRNFLTQYSDPGQAALDAMNSVHGNATQASTNAAGAVSSALGSANMGNLDTPNTPNPGTVELKVGPGKTITVNLNPFSEDGPLGGLVGLAAAFIKRLIAWALVAAFFYEVMKEVRGVVSTAFLTGGYTSQTVDMIKSVNIFGWSVGVPVGGVVRIALIALVVTLVLTLPAAALAALEGGLPWTNLRDVYTQGAPGSGGGTLAAALGYVDYVLPWRLMMSLPLYYILVHNVLFPLQIFWQMVFKFLP